MPIMMIFAVVVIALIVTAGLYEGRTITATGSVAALSTQIGMTARSIQDLYSTQTDDSALTPAAVCQANAYPGALGACGANNAVLTSYGSMDAVSASSVGSAIGNNGFAIRLGAQSSMLTQESCINIVTQVPAYEIRGTPGLLVTNNALPSPSSADAWCKNIAGGQIDFVYAKGQ